MNYAPKAYSDLQIAYKYIMTNMDTLPFYRYYGYLYTKIKKKIVEEPSNPTACISIVNNLPVMKINPSYFSGKCSCDNPNFDFNELKPKQQMQILQYVFATGKGYSIPCHNCGMSEHELTVEQRASLLIHEMQHITHRHLIRSKRIHDALLKEFGFDQPQEELEKQYEAWIEEKNIEALNDFYRRQAQFKAKSEALNQAMDAAINNYNTNLPPNGFYYTLIPDAEMHMSFEEYYLLMLKNKPQPGNSDDDDEEDNNFNLFDGIHQFLLDPSNDKFVEKIVNNLLRDLSKNVSRSQMPPEVIEYLDQLKVKDPGAWKRSLLNWTKASRRTTKGYVPHVESKAFDDIYPALSKKYSLKLDIFVDVSDSIQDKQYIGFMEEVLTIQKHIPSVISLHQWDTQIHTTSTLTNNPPKLIRDSRGCTDVTCVRDYALANGLRNIIVLTDGGFSEVDFGFINVLWAYTKVHNDHSGKSILLDI